MFTPSSYVLWNPIATEGHRRLPLGLCLAYHYMTAGHSDAAAEQLQKVVQLNPKDELSRTLLLTIDPEADIPKARSR